MATDALLGEDSRHRNGSPLLAVQDLVTHIHTPRGVVRAVDGVSFEIQEGKTLGIVGESGSGKSVLIRSIMGLIPQANVRRSGLVQFAGRDLNTLIKRELRRLWGSEIAMIFQDPMSSLNPVRTVEAQLSAPLRRHLAIDGRDARRRSIDLLRMVGIAEPERRITQYPHELSGGMRQRVMIAIALAGSPRVMLADEPTTALDVTVQKQILQLLARQQAERKMAMILVTHDLGVVAAYSDEVAVMYAGKIVERAPTSTLFANVSMPYTEALFRAIPRLADRSHTVVPAIGGRPPDPAQPLVGCSFAPRCSYARERCHRDAPPLLPLSGERDHLVACWYPVGTAASGPETRRSADSSRTTASAVEPEA